MNTGSRTIVGNFSSIQDARNAVADLRTMGYQDVRLIENDADEKYASSSSSQSMSNSQSGSYSSNNYSSEHEGGIKGFFSRLFGFDDGAPTRPLNSETESYFRDTYQNRHHLVIVTAEFEPERAIEVIRRYDGTIEEQSGRLFEQAVYSDNRMDRDRDFSGERVMELSEEQLEVGKERVQTGEVSVRKELITEMKTVEVPVTREEIVVERRSLDGVARDGSLSTADVGRTEEIRIPVSEEHIHVEKKVVPREEIRVSKESRTETETVSEEVRREEARTESEGRVSMRNTEETLKGRGKTRRDTDGIQPGV